jgi:hypothetical protein
LSVIVLVKAQGIVPANSCDGERDRKRCYEALLQMAPHRPLESRASLHLNPDANELQGEEVPRVWQLIIEELWPDGPPADLPAYDHSFQLPWRIADRLAECMT